jgi:DNA primase catalytic core
MNSATIDRVREATNLVEVVERYVDLRKAGSRFVGLCPFHADKNTPSLSIEPNKGLWICYGCRAGGNVFQFLQKIEGIPFPKALDMLAEEAGITDDGTYRRPTMAANSERKQDNMDAAFYWSVAYRKLTDLHISLTRLDIQACAYYEHREIDEMGALCLQLAPMTQPDIEDKLELIKHATRRALVAAYMTLTSPIRASIRRLRQRDI